MRSIAITLLALAGIFFGGCSLFFLPLVIGYSNSLSDLLDPAFLLNPLGFVLAALCFWAALRLHRKKE